MRHSNRIYFGVQNSVIQPFSWPCLWSRSLVEASQLLGRPLYRYLDCQHTPVAGVAFDHEHSTELLDVLLQHI